MPKELVIPNELIGSSIPDIKQLANKRAEEQKKRKARRGGMIKDFKAWIKTPHQSRYEAYEPFGPNALIRLYVYEPPKEKDAPTLYTGFDDDGSGRNQLDSEMLPFAKVLAIGNDVPEHYADLKEGDIVAIPDPMCGVEENEQWKEWQLMHREKPSIERDIPMPPRYIPSLAKWSRYVFKEDKFMPGTRDDAYTFIVPLSILQCKVHTDYIK